MIKKIIIDNRERNLHLQSILKEKGLELEFKNLEIGDYIVGETIIERKTVEDFSNSIINKRFFKQLEDLSLCENKLIMVEGLEEQELYPEDGRINPNAIRSFILTILINKKIPIVFTKSEEDSANFIAILSKKNDKELSFNPKRKSKNANEQMRYILEGFPGIGPSASKKLLKEFGTLKEILNQPIENLQKIIGKKANIFEILEKKFQE